MRLRAFPILLAPALEPSSDGVHALVCMSLLVLSLPPSFVSQHTRISRFAWLTRTAQSNCRALAFSPILVVVVVVLLVLVAEMCV